MQPSYTLKPRSEYGEIRAAPALKSIWIGGFLPRKLTRESSYNDSVLRVLLVLVVLVLLTGCHAYIPEKVTTDGLLAIKKGMTYDEVENLIGPPLCIVAIEDPRFGETDKRVATDLIGGCNPSARTTRSVPQALRKAAQLSVSYAEPRASFMNPRIYLNFKTGHVGSVYIKKDDFGICCMDGLPTSPYYWIGSRKVLQELVGR